MRAEADQAFNMTLPSLNRNRMLKSAEVDDGQTQFCWFIPFSNSLGYTFKTLKPYTVTTTYKIDVNATIVDFGLILAEKSTIVGSFNDASNNKVCEKEGQ